jgi:polysaccharide chain length determinant protein (PEP-CTERM system associated)
MSAASNFVSVSRRPPDIEDYIDMVRRYRSWIIAPTFAGLVIAVVVAFLANDMYRSQAVMRIVPQKVSERLVPSEITQHMTERLNQMEQEILSRSQLSSLIQQPELDLYRKERQQKPLEDVVQDMRLKYVHIGFMGSGGEGNKFASAFSIAFDYPDRYKAKRVVDLLVAKFMDQNFTVLKQNTRATTQFIDDELKTATERMNDLSQKITKFRMENAGKLPEQAQSNVTMVNSLQQALATENEAINRATNQKMMQENQLSGLQNDYAFQSQHLEDTVLTGGSGPMSVKNQRLIELDRAISDLQTNLSEARKVYKDDYPPIKVIIAKIDNLQKQREDVEKTDQATRAANAGQSTGPAAVKVVNPQVQQRLEELKNQMSSLRTALAITTNEIQSRQNRMTELNKRVAEYQSRIESAPLGEQQYAQLIGDYNLAKQQYDEFSKRRNQSETQENINDRQAGETLDLLDPASLPEQSFEPNRAVWIGAGTALGLIVGVLLAGAKEMKDASLKNLKDVRAYTNLPILSSIPLLENALLIRRKRRLFWLAWSTAFIVGTMAMTAAIYWKYFGRTS